MIKAKLDGKPETIKVEMVKELLLLTFTSQLPQDRVSKFEMCFSTNNS